MREYLKKLRKKANLTQTEVASKLGIGEPAYSMIETMERRKDLSLSLIHSFSEIFGVSTDYIIAEERKLHKKRIKRKSPKS